MRRSRVDSGARRGVAPPGRALMFELFGAQQDYAELHGIVSTLVHRGEANPACPDRRFARYLNNSIQAVEMPYAITEEGIRLFYEETGAGEPLLFVHEFAGDLRSWEPQVRWGFRRS